MNSSKPYPMSSPIRTARALRQSMTPEEKLLWRFLRNRNFFGKKARRQHPIIYSIQGFRKDFYVADYYFAADKLVIELDGKHHEFGDQREYDQARDCLLNQLNLRILRIPNEEVNKNISGMLDKIAAALGTPSP